MKISENGDSPAFQDGKSAEIGQFHYDDRVVYLSVNGMSCAKNCAAKIERALNSVPSVSRATVDFSLKRASVYLEPDSSITDNELIDAIRQVNPKFEAALCTSPSNHLRTVLLKIDGMRCVQNCARKVQNALIEMDGVVAASVDFEAKKALVKVDSSHQFYDEMLLEVVNSVGTFNARIISPNTREQTLEQRRLEEETCLFTPDVAISIDEDEIVSATLLIGGMTCNSCSSSVENALKRTEGVVSAVVSFATEKAVIHFIKRLVGIRMLIETVEEIGYEAAFVSGRDVHKSLQDQRTKEILRYRVDFLIALFFTLPILVIMLVFENIPSINHIFMSEIVPGLSWEVFSVAILATPVQFYSARRFHVDAWKGVRNRVLGMAFLVSMGSNVAYLYGLFTVIRALVLKDMEVANLDMFMTSSVLISFVILGKLLEATAKGKTSAALTKLMALQVSSAILLVFNSDETSVQEEREVPIELVQCGDVLKVVRGSSIPVDGVVIYGEGRVDESMLTGESKAIKKVIGDRVLGATMNVDGLFHMKVTDVNEDTALSQIIRLVEDAQTSKAPIQAYADYISSIFVPVVLVLALVTFTVWYILCELNVVPENWIPDSSGKFVFALDFGIATLVVACPCALGLATPTAVMVGTGIGAEHGILIKGGEALESAHNIDTIIFDKTGTLTVGNPIVTDGYIFSKRLNTEELVFLAGSAELGSEHPLGKAIVNYAKSISPSLEQPTDFYGVSGRGISCLIGKHQVVLGNKEWMAENGILDTSEAEQATINFQYAGKTSVYMGVDGTLSAVFAVADAPREEAKQTLKNLKATGLDVWMVTGDNAGTAFVIAEQLGISRDHVMANVLPSEKSSKVKDLQDRSRVVAMVGDGINDSPALVQANLGIAIGGGTQIAIEAADMVLLKSNLWDVITALHLSRTIFNRIRLNYVWAFGYNCMLIPLAAGVLYPVGFSIPPMFASAAMAISSVSVVVSSLLLRVYSPPNFPENSQTIETGLLVFKDQTLATPLVALNTQEYH